MQKSRRAHIGVNVTYYCVLMRARHKRNCFFAGYCWAFVVAPYNEVILHGLALHPNTVDFHMNRFFASELSFEL